MTDNNQSTMPNDEDTPARLFEAVNRGDFNGAEEILKVGLTPKRTRALVNTTFQDRLPLGCAIEHGYLDLVELLLQNGADVNKKDQKGISPLIHCVYEGQHRNAKLLLASDANLRQVCGDGKNLLNYAMRAFVHATRVRLNLLQDLLSTLGVDSVDNNGVTSLIAVCKEEADVAVRDSKVLNAVKFLVRNGASVNAKDTEGNTALYYAVENGLPKTTMYLIQQGANEWSIRKISKKYTHISFAPRKCFPIKYRSKVLVVYVFFKWSAGVMQGITLEMCEFLFEQLFCIMHEPAGSSPV